MAQATLTPMLLLLLLLAALAAQALALAAEGEGEEQGWQGHHGFQEAGHRHLDDGKAAAAAAAAAAAGGSFWGGFVNGVGMIIATEIGDKTFFLAAVMAMQHSRLLIFTGALSALAVMTILSAALGFALPNLLPREYTHYAGALLFLYFGAKMIKEGMDAEGEGPSDELAEVEEELLGMSSKKDSMDIEMASNSPNGRSSASSEWTSLCVLSKSGMAVLSQSFTMTFLAEWGDRSQIATIALAAAKNVYGVTLGGILGHAGCTGLAVLGGRMLAAQISERTVHFAGGALFLLFGFHSLVFGM